MEHLPFEDHWKKENEDILRGSILELYNHMFTDNLNRGMSSIEKDNIYDKMKKEYLKFADETGAILNEIDQSEFHRKSKQYVERLVNTIRRNDGLGKLQSKKKSRKHKRKSRKHKRKSRKHKRKSRKHKRKSHHI